VTIKIARQSDGTFIDADTGADISHLISAYKAFAVHEQRVQAAKRGGKAKSPAKAEAAKINGKLGGRPKKTPSVDAQK
jgi:hypothetical protein